MLRVVFPSAQVDVNAVRRDEAVQARFVQCAYQVLFVDIAVASNSGESHAVQP